MNAGLYRSYVHTHVLARWSLVHQLGDDVPHCAGLIGGEDLESDAAVVAVDSSWYWVITWVVVAGVGVLRLLAVSEKIRLPEHRWGTAKQVEIPERNIETNKGA